MNAILEPVTVQSLPEACIHRLETLILSGQLKRGERLPSERRLAEMLDVSRPVVHQALVDLEAKGLVTIQPRSGVYVNDYRRSGSMAILTSLLNYQGEALDTDVESSLIEFRRHFETEMAYQAALRSERDQLDELHILVDRELEVLNQINAGISQRDSLVDELIELDFEFHQAVAIASGNLVYPLIINSFKSVYTHLTGKFFSWYAAKGIDVLRQVNTYHVRLLEAISAGDAQRAAEVMRKMLDHGSRYLATIGDSNDA